MTTQLEFLAAAVLDGRFVDGIASRLSEPSAATMVLVSLAGVLVGRFLLPAKSSSTD